MATWLLLSLLMVSAGSISPSMSQEAPPSLRLEIERPGLIWVCDSHPTVQARALIEILKTAENKGLYAEDYDGPLWPGRVAALEHSSRSEADLARFDVALTTAAMHYVSDLATGRLNPRRVHVGIDAPGEPLDLSRFLSERLARAEDVGAVLDSIETPFPAYRRLMGALHHYLELVRQDDGGRLPKVRRPIAPGQPYAGLPRLGRLLRLLGDLPPQAPVGATYDGEMVEAVKRFQGRHGLLPDGRIDSRTVAALNTPLSRRVLQLQFALERLRWLPHKFPRPPLVINVPEFRLHGDDVQYRWVLSMKVIVGRAYKHKTPLFASRIEEVIFRPPWNVPFDIQREELVPLLQEHPRLIGELGYEIVDQRTRAVEGDRLEGETVERLRAGELVLRQKPGPHNALGSVKFVFPNRYGVYLHGTPEGRLFAQTRRDFSHGCIRVEDPAGLAAWVLADRPEWTPERIREAMTGDRTIRVRLANPIPVLVLYSTAVVTEDGIVHFFEDVYGHDRVLERALGLVEGQRS